jgi:hypothetical protein
MWNPRSETSAGANDRVADSGGFRDELFALYAELAASIEQAGPTCQLSGRCCRFAEFGHTLFLSAVEVALLLNEAPPPVRPLDADATCPWQDEHQRCTARDARPLGCRVYYCDPNYEPEIGPALTERFLGRLKRLTERHHLPWNYAPLHHHLRAAVEAGAIAFPESAAGPIAGP